MRTTLDIDERLLRAAKKAAAERGIPLRRVVEESLAQALSQRGKRPPKTEGLRWIVTRGRPASGVDFADRDRLYEVMEGRD
jgi:hypothetical protein